MSSGETNAVTEVRERRREAHLSRDGRAHVDFHSKDAALLETEGLTTKSFNGTVYPHPAVGIVKDAAHAMNAAATKLPLCKSSRAPRDAVSTG